MLEVSHLSPQNSVGTGTGIDSNKIMLKVKTTKLNLVPSSLNNEKESELGRRLIFGLAPICQMDNTRSLQKKRLEPTIIS